MRLVYGIFYNKIAFSNNIVLLVEPLYFFAPLGIARLYFFNDGTVCSIECKWQWSEFPDYNSFFHDLRLFAILCGVDRTIRFVIFFVAALYTVIDTIKIFRDFAISAKTLDVSFCFVASVFFGKHAVVVKKFPHADVVSFIVVMVLECFFPVKMPTFPVSYGVVVFVILNGFDLFVLVVDCPLAVFFSLVVIPD